MHPNTSWLCTAATAISALKQWRSVASYKPLPVMMLGFSSWPEFDGAVEELRDTIERQQPLSELDWTRVLVLTEIARASDVLGAGLDFELVSSVSDADAVELLRSIQRKLAFKADADLLFSDAGRPRRPFDYDAWKAKNGPSG